MIFRNLNLYRLSGPVDSEQLESLLDENAFHPLMPSQEKTAGFTPILGLDSRLFCSGHYVLFCLIIQEKLLPKAAVKAEYQKVLQEKEADGNRLTKAERNALKDLVREEMLPRAFPKNNEIWAYIDNRNKILAINTSSRKNADGLAQTIRGAVEDGGVFPIRPQHDVGARMTFWVSEDQAPDPFSLGLKCNITDGEGSIAYRKRSLEDAKLREYLHADMTVSEVELNYSDRHTFCLVEDFMIKEFVLSEAALADLDTGSGEPLEELAGDLHLMGGEVSSLLESLLNALGGEENSSL